MLNDNPSTSTHTPLATQRDTMLPQSASISPALISYNHVTYGLAVFSFFTAGLTWIIPIVMSYIKRDEARGTWLYSHFDWQIKTFWYSIFFGAIALVLIFLGFGAGFIGLLSGSQGVAGGSMLLGIVGVLFFGLVVLWHLYRTVRGWIALTNRRPVP